MKNKSRALLASIGAILIVLSFVIAGLGVWEIFGKGAKNVHSIQVPGFAQLDLNDAGAYSAFYQHQRPGPMPVNALASLQVSVMFKETYEFAQVITNTAGQTVERLGVRGMPVFTFFAERPGFYSITTAYPEGAQGPTLPVTVISESAANVKQTLIATILSFVLFLGLGVFVLFRMNKWAPR